MPENGHYGKSIWKFLPSMVRSCILLTLCVMAGGCGTTGSELAIKAVAAQHISYTDDVSRQLALRSQGMLQERLEDYRIGPEDVLEITIFEWELREETKTVEVRVAESGIVSLPVIGDIEARGLTVAEIKNLTERRLVDGGFIRAPRVSIIVKEFRSKKIAVVGAVTDPGVYTLRQNVTTLLDILSLAGGVSENAGYLLYVTHTMPNSESVGPKTSAVKSDETAMKDIIAIDLYELMETGDLSLNVVLRNGDIVNVPEAKRFSVIGYVGEPGRFPLRKPTTVLEGIALAKGLKRTEASPRSCVLRRCTADGEIIIPLNLVSISEGEAPNLYLMPNDVIEVKQTGRRRVLLEALDTFKYLFSIGYVFN